MTRDDLRGIVEGISDEQLKKILDINSSDIGKAKLGAGETKTELEEANRKISEMETELQTLRDGQCEAEKMRTKIEELQKVIDNKALEEEKRALESAVEGRFNSVVGDAKFLNDYTRNGVYALFSEALNSAENQGKSDQEIFEGITGGCANVFAEENSAPSVVASTTGFGGDLSQGDIREIMGLPT